MAVENQNAIDVKVETNRVCPFCGSNLYLIQMIPKKLGTKFCFTCNKCMFSGRKLITDQYQIKEEGDKCIITFVGK